jgi:hypothetical protein
MVMAATVDIHNTGKLPEERSEIKAVIEHALAGRAGKWHVSIVGSQASDQWEMRIMGPNEFERTYTLEGESGEHGAQAIGRIVATMLPRT